MGGAQPALGGSREIVGVRRDHHAIAGRAIERLGGGEVDARLGLVVAGDLGAEDRVPANVVVAREIGHERDVAIRDRRDQEPLPQALEPGRHVGPGIEAMPREIQITQDVLGQILQSEPRQDALEVAAMEHVELRERDAARAHLLHARLIFVAPGIGEGRPVEGMAARPEDRRGLARDAAAPIDQGPEHVEEQRLHGDRHEVRSRCPRSHTRPD